MESILNGFLAQLKGKQVAVVGIGISNTPLIRKLLEGGIRVTAADKRLRAQFGSELEELEQLGLKTYLGPDYLDHIKDADVIFRTPGLRPDVPQLVEAVQQGAVLTSEMEVFVSLCPCRCVAVTGSDGKTTTTTIIAGLLEAAGNRVFVGGNIGHPLLAQVDEIRPDDIVVLELSSFQLLTMRQSPDIAVVTNISPNHLDVHKGMEEYIAAKKNIFAWQDNGGLTVLNADNEITAGFAKEVRGDLILFSRQKALDRGVWLQNGTVVHDGHPVLRADEIRLPGVHNLENYMAAIAAVDALVPDEVIQEYARTFNGVEHRIELCRELNGVKYYNDSIASSPTRTIAGLRSFQQKVILIAGGYDKHIPYDVLGPEVVEHVKHLFLTGATAPKIKEAVLNAPQYTPGTPAITDCENLQDAVVKAQAAAQPGDVVILSPASASFDCFRNFMERGNAFKQFVNELN